MENSSVRVVTLPPMRVASFYAYSEEPELEAYQKLQDWAKQHVSLQTGSQPRIFGFDIPATTHASPKHGYEFWLTVGPEVQAEGDMEIKEFGGGLYAVLLCEVKGDPWASIPGTWKKLVEWRENSRYQGGSHQCLEEQLAVKDHAKGEFNLDLYLPIRA